MNALFASKPLIAVAALCCVATLTVGTQIALSHPAPQESALNIDPEAPSETPADEATAAVELPRAEDAAAPQAAQVDAFVPNVAQPADPRDAFIPYGGPRRVQPTDPLTVDLRPVGEFFEVKSREVLLKRFRAVFEHRQRIEDQLRDKEEELAALARESGSTLAPENATRKQLNLDQIGRLQAEILEMRRELSLKGGDMRRAYIEELQAEAEELRQEVSLHSQSHPELLQRQRVIDALQEIQRELTQRVEWMRLEIDLLPQTEGEQ